MIAASYPLADAFLTMLYIFLFVLWLFILFRVIIDIFGSHDMGGWGKAAWLIFILVFPLLGVLVYLIARGDKMQRHEVQAAEAQNAAFDKYIRETVGVSSTVDQLAKLHDLKTRGAITDAEYDHLKEKLVAQSAA
jgi:ABC-type multidrug transport system fused ATPase/permease subunit